MKLKYMIMAGCLCLTSACSDFLDHPLTTSVSDDNIGEIIQKNPSKIGEFLASSYRSLGGILLYGRQSEYMSTMSHEMDIDWLGEEQRNQWATNSLTSSNKNVEEAYTKYYKALSSANLALDLIDHVDMEQLDETKREMIDNFRGEALFLRAFIHFDLLRMFGEKGPDFGGGYPNNKDAQGIILMEGLADANTAIAPRSTVGECYEAILRDLKEAEEYIGDNQIPVNTAVLAPGYQDTDYTSDLGWAQKPAVYALLGKVYLYMNDFTNAKTEFEKVLSDGRFALDRPVNFTDHIQHNDNNAECIFSLQYYLANSGTAYDDAPEHHLVRIFGGAPGAWNNYFVDQRTAARFGDDPRLYEATLYDYDIETWCTATEPVVFKKVDPTVPGFRYYQRKYTDFYKVSNYVFSNKNVDMIRLGDVYLMYAEVMLNLGDTNTATEYVNKLRRRAWDESDYNAPGTKGEDFTTVTMEILQEERYKELFFENTRWYDLCRWGILEQELAKYPSSNAGAVHYDPQDYYVPIPESELRSNPLLRQSKGY